jgi:peptidoglycan/xylan/chitin deacetylase (PgdA/CDA1 family)
MPLWKWLLLDFYYHASKPARWWIQRRLAAQRRMPIAVLYYHRIADDAATQWTMPNRTFIDQMCWLRRNFEMISLDEAQRRMRSGVNDRAAVHVTFDDGYADNCRTAIPWLVQERIPCTYFVTAQNILERRPFDHDLKCGVNLAPNSREEIRTMANAGIEIGAHTYSHPDLGKLADSALLHREVVFARQELEAAIGGRIRYFAFPFGMHVNLSRPVFALAAQCGYEGVCSAYGGYNYPGDDPFHVQRIPTVCEMLRLKNWLTADPRRIYTRRFQYRWNEDRVGPPRDHAKIDEALALGLPGPGKGLQIERFENAKTDEALDAVSP